MAKIQTCRYCSRDVVWLRAARTAAGWVLVEPREQPTDEVPVTSAWVYLRRVGAVPLTTVAKHPPKCLVRHLCDEFATTQRTPGGSVAELAEQIARTGG